MKFLYVFFTGILLLPYLLFAQNNESDVQITVGGFVRNDLIFNTRENLSARGENQFNLAPLPIQLDENGEDINANNNFNMAVLVSRINFKIAGAEAFGAKILGFVEADFLGISVATKYHFRLRHAYFTMNWKKSSLQTGMYWHPTFVTNCYPGTVSFNTGVPFNPLSRAPQIRYSHQLTDKWNILGAILSQGHFVSVAPVGAAIHSGIPELHAQLQFKSPKLNFGIGVNHQSLKPSLSISVVDTANNAKSYRTDSQIHSLSYFGYLKYTFKKVEVKSYLIYGQNNDNLVMMGGYAQLDPSLFLPVSLGDLVQYTAYSNLSTWIDLATLGKKIRYGIFAGYSKNLGASEDILRSSYVGRWGDVNRMFRIAPRVVFISNKVEIGFEIEYSMAEYALGNKNGINLTEQTGIDDRGRVVNFKAADNYKAILAMTYSF